LAAKLTALHRRGAGHQALLAGICWKNCWKSEAFTIKFLNHNGGMTMENSQ
jgi:hypothetical protein